MTPDEATKILVRHALMFEHVYEDRGRDYNECWSCGWNTAKDATPEVRFGHHPGCELRAAIDLLDK